MKLLVRCFSSNYSFVLAPSHFSVERTAARIYSQVPLERPMKIKSRQGYQRAR